MLVLIENSRFEQTVLIVSLTNQIICMAWSQSINKDSKFIYPENQSNVVLIPFPSLSVTKNEEVIPFTFLSGDSTWSLIAVFIQSYIFRAPIATRILKSVSFDEYTTTIRNWLFLFRRPLSVEKTTFTFHIHFASFDKLLTATTTPIQPIVK